MPGDFLRVRLVGVEPKISVPCLDKERRRVRDFCPAVWAKMPESADATQYKLGTVVFGRTLAVGSAGESEAHSVTRVGPSPPVSGKAAFLPFSRKGRMDGGRFI